MGDEDQGRRAGGVSPPVTLVPTLCVGTPAGTHCVPSGDGAECPDVHSHAERGNEELVTLHSPLSTLHSITPLILAGGLGTRLRSVVGDQPKVLASVKGRPFLTYVLDQLAAYSFRQVVLLTGYQAEKVKKSLGDSYKNLALIYSAEATPLGTAGAIYQALSYITSPTALLLNGDSYCSLDLNAFIEFHHRYRADVSMALAQVNDAGRFGRVQCDSAGKITAFCEKQSPGEPGWINAGIYLLERALLETIPPQRPLSLERDLMSQWIKTKEVYGFHCQGPFLDIGTPESYASAAGFCAAISRE